MSCVHRIKLEVVQGCSSVCAVLLQAVCLECCRVILSAKNSKLQHTCPLNGYTTHLFGGRIVWRQSCGCATAMCACGALPNRSHTYSFANQTVARPHAWSSPLTVRIADLLFCADFPTQYVGKAAKANTHGSCVHRMHYKPLFFEQDALFADKTAAVCCSAACPMCRMGQALHLSCSTTSFVTRNLP